jgi:hypothetical protein
MANPSVTYTFSNGTTADADQVNTNFTDIINSLTDGTKSLTIDAITAGGAATFNGDVTLGNGTVDDITITGSLASDFPIKTTNTYDIGSASIGLAIAYFGSSAGAFTTALTGATVTADYTLTLPIDGGTDGYAMQTNGSGTTTWEPINDPSDKINYAIGNSVAASALTITLLGGDGNALSSSNKAVFSFRSSTLATGTASQQEVTSAISLVIPSTATMGHTSGDARWLYLYALDNSGTVELAVSTSPEFDENQLHTTTALSTGSDSVDVLYSTTGRTNKAIRLIGRLLSNQATAGTWASAATEVSITDVKNKPRTERRFHTLAGVGGTDTKIPYFSTTVTDIGTAITTTTNDSTNGLQLTINEAGVYTASYCHVANVAMNFGMSLNSSQLTTDVDSITAADRIAMGQSAGADAPEFVGWTGVLREGDVIRPHVGGGFGVAAASVRGQFTLTKVSD